MAKQGRKSAKGKMIAGIVLCAVACCLFAGGALALTNYQKEYEKVQQMRQVVDVDTFYPGVQVNGVELGGMTLDDATTMFKQDEQELSEQFQLKLRAGTNTWNLAIPLSFNTEEILNQAYQVGREGTLEERYAAVTALQTTPQQFTVEYTASTDELTTMATKIETELLVQKVDATVESFDVTNKTFVFTQEVNGQHVDKAALMEKMSGAIKDKNFDWIEVPVVEDPAEVTQETLSKNYRQLATFSTTATSSKARNTNISIALAAFNGKAVQPGETFSINECTGKRTADKGYKPAGSIVNGELIDELGGGVCQVSSTLFNAVVRAGLTVTERHNHSWPSTYVDAGMDAAIDYGSKDLKFVNNSTGTIYLVSSFDWDKQKLTVEVYGVPILPEGTKVTLKATRTSKTDEPASIYNEDKTLAAGQVVQQRKGRSGSTYNTKVIYTYTDGKTETGWEFTSTYRAIAAIYRVGVGTVIDDGTGTTDGGTTDGGTTEGETTIIPGTP